MSGSAGLLPLPSAGDSAALHRGGRPGDRCGRLPGGGAPLQTGQQRPASGGGSRCRPGRPRSPRRSALRQQHLAPTGERAPSGPAHRRPAGGRRAWDLRAGAPGARGPGTGEDEHQAVCPDVPPLRAGGPDLQPVDAHRRPVPGGSAVADGPRLDHGPAQ